ncbi:MAG: hypothetical protein Fur0018_10970 [Anaerolineales bacterium]
MMAILEKAQPRLVTENDRLIIANLMHFERYVHRHLGWRSPLEWIGAQPYLLLEDDGTPVVALASPPDCPGVAWIQLFAARDGGALSSWWHTLWEAARETLQQHKPMCAAALPLQSWFTRLIVQAGFEQVDTVVMLAREWNGAALPPPSATVRIRLMTIDDLPEVTRVDHAAFPLLWRQSADELYSAYRQAATATVAEKQGQVVGYQIGTAVGQWAGHLARLAVLPDFQGGGIGTALVSDMLSYFSQKRIGRVTVNTQGENDASLRLYQKLGFRLTGESVPMYALEV